MASHANAGVPSLISVSRHGDYVVRANGKELVVHTAAEFDGSRVLHCTKLKEPLASQLKFLKISYSDTSDDNDNGGDEGLLDLVPRQRLLCASDNRVSVLQINSMEWDAEIENIDPAITYVDFGARNDEVIVFHSWNSKVTIFNLDSGRSQVIKSPKFCNPNGYGYRPRTRQFAILLKPETSDLLTLHEIQTYELITRVALPTVDAQGLKWSPDGRWIAVWEAASAGTKVLIYTADGQLFRAYTGVPECDGTYDLGVRTIEWGPVNRTSQILAVGKFDGTVDLLNSRTFSCSTSLSHTFHIDSYSPTIWRERYSGIDGSLEYAEASSSSAFTTTSESSGPPRGVSMIQFSYNGNFLATLDQSLPNVVWIWSLISPIHLKSVLVHEHNVRQFAWHPSEPELLVTTNNSAAAAVRLWSLNRNPVIATVPIARNDAGRYEISWFGSVRGEPSTFWFSTPDDAVLGYVALQDERPRFNLLHSVSRAGDLMQSQLRNPFSRTMSE
ncbi:hypothetical protein VTN77DRAFT_7693 [Rasamsonia byssochlamydoides]|uniref:uncharacterized protein n=1 Tax=Rasamsonia byssochlamydoides TaxID=89139 RepID=UPI00374251DE